MIEWHPASLELLELRHWRLRQIAIGQCDANQSSDPQPKNAAPAASALQLPEDQRVLLEKILQAIGQSAANCRIQVVSSRQVVVHLPDGRQLIFNTLDGPDDNQAVYLTGLADMLQDPAMKKPVWHKLKNWLGQ